MNLQKTPRLPLPLALALPLALGLLVASTGCMRLDTFLFNGLEVDEDVDLMAAAEAIPRHLIEEHYFDAEDGTKVNAYMLWHDASDGTPAHRHERAILYCHGNKHHIGEYVLRAEAMWKQGYSVLIFDYRGYGKTKGTSTEEGAYMDARAAREYLEEYFERDKVGLYGYSLGTAVCAKLASESPTPALTLEAPFSSIKALSNGSLGLEAPAEWFADSGMETVERIKEHAGALFILHGLADDFIRPEHGQEIHEAAKGHASSRELWLVKDATHSSAPCAKHSGDRPLGGCAGGFSDEYLSRFTKLYDKALKVE